MNSKSLVHAAAVWALLLMSWGCGDKGDRKDNPTGPTTQPESPSNPVPGGGGTPVPPEDPNDIEQPGRVIQFAGRSWQVRSSPVKSLPGPNYYSNSNNSVWVDAHGRLHMKIRRYKGKLLCAEVNLVESLGYGRYIFHLGGGNLDYEFSTLGLFTWDNGAPQAHHREIDIEFGRWGRPNGYNVQYIVQPKLVHRTEFDVNSGPSFHSFEWDLGRVYFQGGRTRDSEDISRVLTGDDIFPKGNEKAVINLWASNADTVRDNVEFVINGFEFVPRY